MTLSARLRASLPAARPYAVVALALLAGFYGLHWTGNLVPQERSFAFVKQAFEAGVLDPGSDWLDPSTDARSVSSVNRFSDCRTLLSVVAPPSAGLAETLSPSMMVGSWDLLRCSALWLVVTEQDSGSRTRSKTRYWHGTVAMIATLLHVPSITLLQISETIKASTHFAWMLLAILALAHSRRLFAVLAPLIVGGVFFSAIPFYGTFSYGVPYLFAVLALAGLVRLMTVRTPDPVLRLWFFAAGMVSSYLFLLEGHQLLLVPGALVILHFGREDADLRTWARLALGCLAAFALGFVLSYLVNQAGKVAVLGWDRVVPNFLDQLAHRFSLTAPTGEPVSAFKAVDRLFSYGYPLTGFMGNMSLAWTVYAVSLLSFLVGVVAAAQRVSQAGNLAPATGVVVLAVAAGLVFARVGILPNHSVQHFLFMGRWMFVPLALALAAPIALWGRRSEVPQPLPPPGSGGPRRGRRGRRPG